MEESELIDNYLKGELGLEQSKDFSAQLQLDSELQKKVALRKLVIAGISQSYAEELKSKLATFDHSLEIKKRFRFSWKMAAVFTSLIISASIFHVFTQKPGPYDFDMDEPGLRNMMGPTDDIEFNNAMNIFKTGDHVASGQVFNNLLANNTNNDTLLYFSGLCEFRAEQTQTAIQKWNRIDVSSVFFEKAEYRLAIAYWVMGDEKMAATLLDKIAGKENYFLKQQSEKALEALK